MSFRWVIDMMINMMMHPKSFVGELGDDSVELIESEAFIGSGFVVDVGAVHKFEEFVIVEVVEELFGDSFELFEVDGSVLVLVEQGEHLLEAVLGLGLTDSVTDDVEELVEVDGSVLVSKSDDEGEDEGVSLVKAEFFKGFVDFSGIDGAASVFVEDFEGVLEFFVVLGGEAVFPVGEGDCGLCGGWGGGCGFGSAHLSINGAANQFNFPLIKIR
jgi:hypothetical protein